MDTIASADVADRLRKAGVRRSPIDGLPVSLKDLFDVRGTATTAASRVRASDIAGAALTVALSASASLGPVFAAVRNIGVRLSLLPVPQGQKPGAFGDLDLRFVA